MAAMLSLYKTTKRATMSSVAPWTSKSEKKYLMPSLAICKDSGLLPLFLICHYTSVGNGTSDVYHVLGTFASHTNRPILWRPKAMPFKKIPLDRCSSGSLCSQVPCMLALEPPLGLDMRWVECQVPTCYTLLMPDLQCPNIMTSLTYRSKSGNGHSGAPRHGHCFLRESCLSLSRVHSRASGLIVMQGPFGGGGGGRHGISGSTGSITKGCTGTPLGPVWTQNSRHVVPSAFLRNGFSAIAGALPTCAAAADAAATAGALPAGGAGADAAATADAMPAGGTAADVDDCEAAFASAFFLYLARAWAHSSSLPLRRSTDSRINTSGTPCRRTCCNKLSQDLPLKFPQR